MAPRPSHLIVRDRATGRPVEVPTDSIPREIWPEEWFSNAYWMYRPDRRELEPLIKSYLLDEPMRTQEVQRLARYMVDYACHIAMMGYLFGGGQAYLELNVPTIRRLRELKAKATLRWDISEMVCVAREKALDAL